MDARKYIQKIKLVYNIILAYINNVTDFEDNYYYESLIKMYQPQNQDDFKLFLHLISEISKNHHRDQVFFNKIERIFFTL